MVPLSVSWGEVAAATTVLLGAFAVLGAFYRWVLLPNLREELRPMRQTNLEVTGGRAEPSLREVLDQVVHKQDELAAKHDQHSGEIEDAALELRAMALMFDGHLTWAQEEVDRLRKERQAMVDEIWQELRRQRADAAAGEEQRHPGARHRRDDASPAYPADHDDENPT